MSSAGEPVAAAEYGCEYPPVRPPHPMAGWSDAQVRAWLEPRMGDSDLAEAVRRWNAAQAEADRLRALCAQARADIAADRCERSLAGPGCGGCPWCLLGGAL